MWSIAWRLIIDSFWINWIGKSITLLSIIASISGFTIKHFINLEPNYLDRINWKDLLIVVFVVVVIRIIYVSSKIIKEYEFSQSANYTPAKLIKHIKEIILICNDFSTQVITKEICLAEVCNKLRDCFNKLTQSNCCVSIKIIEDKSDGNYEMSIDELQSKKVKNIVRDNNHGSRDTEEYINIDHYIRENTAYFTIIGKLHKSQIFYRCNDVSRDNDYITSSPYEYDAIPYKSELVFPVLEKKNNQCKFKGFICVDSDKKNAFGKDTLYLDLTSMVADSLYLIL